MGKLFESLKAHLEHTPKDVLEKEWDELAFLDNIGPNVVEYLSMVYAHLSIADFRQMQRNVNVVGKCLEDKNIETQASYYMAA